MILIAILFVGLLDVMETQLNLLR